jgi:hypothetical protein
MEIGSGACFNPPGGGFGIEDSVGVRKTAIPAAGSIGDLNGESTINRFIVAVHQACIDFGFVERQRGAGAHYRKRSSTRNPHTDSLSKSAV